ncbi:MAG TPA: glycosyltransferase family 1 protein [Anaerolineales bacterium]|nr:glycosyltransferase family 1 protein [Anaerolineales bacterium]
MHLAFLNPQGNFDPADSYWTQHPDFGGQLVYVKQLAQAMGAEGHRVDILTRRVLDPEWPEFAAPFDAYTGIPNVRIVRLRAGPDHFLRKEDLWPHLVRDWAPNILAFYRHEGRLPDVFTGHYADGGLCGVLIEAETGVPFTFTAHSLGAQKMDKLDVTRENLAEMDARYHFGRRIIAERLSMNRSAVNITSTHLERFEQYAHPAYRGAVDVADDRRFAVTPPGVALSIFDAEARSEDEEAIHRYVAQRLARDLEGDRRGLPAIVASSRIDPKKNHLGLVRAFAQSQVLQERANLVLITGALDDPLRQDTGATPAEREVLAQVREVVAAHDLWGKVSGFALEGQPALAAAYRFLARRGSVFALTAHYEPFGLAPLEAAAAGLPVVVTRNGGPSESLREGGVEYGVLVDPADPADIARGLERLLTDRTTWAEFARRGRQRVLARYTWERTAEEYLAIIKEILLRPEARRSSSHLPIHPYFRDPRPETDVSLAELEHLYYD